jgi:hypothetical protein
MIRFNWSPKGDTFGASWLRRSAAWENWFGFAGTLARAMIFGSEINVRRSA